VRLGGERIGVESDSRKLIEWLRKAYPTGGAPRVDVVGYHAASFDEAVAWTEWEITRAALNRQRAPVIHAALVESILIVGAHGSGKSSLAMALKSRRRVYADDLVLLREGRVEAMARPLALKAGSERWFGGRIQATPRYLPLSASKPLRVTDIVVLGSKRGAMKLASITAESAVAHIARHAMTKDVKKVIAAAAKVARRARCWRLGGGTPLERAERLCRISSTT